MAARNRHSPSSRPGSSCMPSSCIGAKGSKDIEGVYRTNGILSDIICMDVCQSINLLMMVSGGFIHFHSLHYKQEPRLAQTLLFQLCKCRNAIIMHAFRSLQ